MGSVTDGDSPRPGSAPQHHVCIQALPLPDSSQPTAERGRGTDTTPFRGCRGFSGGRRLTKLLPSAGSTVRLSQAPSLPHRCLPSEISPTSNGAIVYVSHRTQSNKDRGHGGNANELTPRGRIGGEGIAPWFRWVFLRMSIHRMYSIIHTFPRCDTELHGITFVPQTGRASYCAIK